MSVNGVDMIVEEWRTAAPGEAVIDYYRDQMVARGWRDATLELFDFGPDATGTRGGGNSTASPRKPGADGAPSDSTLVLNRGRWSMQVLTRPNEEQIQNTGVRIVAAATPSIRDFFLSMAANAFGSGPLGMSGGPIDTVEESGDQRRRTLFTARNGEPGEIFDEMLGEYRSKGWQCIVVRSPNQERSDYFAWMLKGRAYATVGVRSAQREGSCWTELTEITPK